MSEIARLPGVCSVCDERKPITADVRAEVDFANLPGETFRFTLKLCPQCCEHLRLSEDAARAAVAAYPGAAEVSRMPKCACGADAVVMGSKGFQCRICAFK